MIDKQDSNVEECSHNKKLAVYTSARFGVEHVAQNIVKQIANTGVEVSYYTTPSNDIPDAVTGRTLTPGWTGSAIDRVDGSFLYRPTVLLLRNILFWRQAFRHASNKHKAFDAIWFNGPHPLVWGRNKEVTASSPIAEKSLVTLHGPVYLGEQRKSVDSIYYQFREQAHERALDQCRSNISVVGPHIYDQVTSINPPTDVIQIGNGVDTSTFRPNIDTHAVSDLIDQTDSATTFLSLGRLTEQKRPFRMIDVYNHLSAQIDNTHLLVAGTGEKRDELERYVEKNDVKGVEFLGFVSEEFKHQLYAYADVFIQMSKYEGGYPPLTIAEAMSAGTAIVASDILDHKIVTRANCGVLIDHKMDLPDDLEDFVESISYYQSNSREYAMEHLDWEEKRVDYLDCLFDSV